MWNGSFTTNRNDLYGELFNVYRQFLPYAESGVLEVAHEFSETEKMRNFVSVNGQKYFFENEHFLCADKLQKRRIELRQIKLALYKALEGGLKRSLPWGALTGVRPTKLAYEMLSNGIEEKNIAEEMRKEYLISESKSHLIQSVIINQKGYYTKNQNKVNFYIHIPFCPTRCYYCSFIAVPLAKQKNLLNTYVERLTEDIKRSVEILSNAGKSVLSVYIGGGTPSVLSAEQLETVLSAVPYRDVEFTCEAGRPDTLTAEKAEIMKRYGVTRVSVNPQTLNDKTLKLIGRNHTVEEFYNAYELMKSYGFVINTDLIAGLEGEGVRDFKHSIDRLWNDLCPDNITVHTLSAKNGSNLKDSVINSAKDAYGAEESFIAQEMVDYAYTALPNAGFEPYYIYRQKNMLANLENAGYSLNGKQCVNNITVMEECLSVMACGSGAISKRLYNECERIERHAQIKDVKQYNEDFENRFEIKKRFWKDLV